MLSSASLTLSVATVIDLTRELSTRGESIGCLNNEYRRIENIEDEEFQSAIRKDVLLHPRSAAEIYCRNLKLDLTGSSECRRYYACRSVNCSLLTYYRQANCRCRKEVRLELKVLDPVSVPQDQAVFVKPQARFMTSDDLQVKPLSTTTGLKLLNKLEASSGSTEERTVSIGRDEARILAGFFNQSYDQDNCSYPSCIAAA